MRSRLVSSLVCVGLLLAMGCGRASPQRGPATAKGPARVNWGVAPIDLPQVEQKPGAAVVLLVDTSGSMGQTVRDRGGHSRPKNLIARDAIDRIIAQTADWKKTHPDRPLDFGILTFSSSVHERLPIGPFDEAKARDAVRHIPPPNSGTAIGVALEKGYQALYKSGRIRKYVVCITDGENTSGLPPDRVANQLYSQTKGEVEIHFVAFDTSARHFDFVKGINGHVVEASNGEQLQAELTKIYEKRILAEAEEPAER